MNTSKRNHTQSNRKGVKRGEGAGASRPGLEGGGRGVRRERTHLPALVVARFPYPHDLRTDISVGCDPLVERFVRSPNENIRLGRSPIA